MLFCTVGVHPTRCGEFDEYDDVENGVGENGYMKALIKLVDNHPFCVAVGEIGLDYHRLQFCDAARQRKRFEEQILAFEHFSRPLFLHLRGDDDAFTDFIDILSRNRHRFSTGVVHSFDGTIKQALYLINQLDLYIGVNGCSLKTEEMLAVVAQLPVDRLMVETDSPWCGIKPSHASFKHVKSVFPAVKAEKYDAGAKELMTVKDRSEPLHLINVIEVIAAVKNMDVDELIDLLHTTTIKVFFPNEEGFRTNVPAAAQAGSVIDWLTLSQNVTMIRNENESK